MVEYSQDTFFGGDSDDRNQFQQLQSNDPSLCMLIHFLLFDIDGGFRIIYERDVTMDLRITE